MKLNEFPRYEVWFVAGSQHLYGPEALKQVADDTGKIVAALNADAGFPVSIVLKPTVTTGDQVTRTLRQANADDRCAGIITWMHTFSPAKMWITGLSELRKPLLQLHTQYNRDIPWSSIDMDFMNLNQTAHGGREFGFMGSRLRLERKVVVGHYADPTVHERVDAWVRAAVAQVAAGAMKVARIGDNMREVAVTEGDKVEAQRIFGYSVNGYGVGDLVAFVDGVSDVAVDGLVKEYRDTYEFAPGLDEGPDADRVRAAAGIELGLRTFLEDGGFSAFTTTFENLHGLKQLPGIAVQRLMADGYGFGAEGDWKTAALLRSMKTMDFGLAGGTSFMEDYTYHFDPARPLVLGSHMLEVCPSIAEGPVRLVVHPLGIGGKDDPARLVFTGGAGPAINVSVMDMGSRFRFVVNDVETVLPPEDLPNLPVARVAWDAKPDLATAAAAWIFAGGAHHTGYSRALTAEHISDFASMCGVEFLKIGDGTTVDSFKNELRWNDLYYHIARGM